jgi:hypothetical protein
MNDPVLPNAGKGTLLIVLFVLVLCAMVGVAVLR